ncbi:hypothetical protein C0J52_01388 [Blattella germanica]|nr:hypothetical protein C0J52_01388 [Blattella germanica]
MDAAVTDGDPLQNGVMKRTRVKKKQDTVALINCCLSETLTPTTCTKVLKEIAKYIVCHKLIPYPYEALKNIASKHYNAVQTADKAVHIQKKKAIQMKRHEKKMIDAYENFENIFKNVELELYNCITNGDEIEEVVLLLGATVRSPHEVYRIIVPPMALKEPVHREGERILLHLIRHIVMSEELNKILSHAMSPTNMYVMLKKKEGKSSEWFLPNDAFNIPRCGRQASIYLSDLSQRKVKTELPSMDTVKQESLSELLGNLHILPSNPRWFLSPISLKGFRLPR